MGGNDSSLFNLIAPIYNMFYKQQVRYYSEVLERVRVLMDFSNDKSIIDIGCGTGALCNVLDIEGFKVTGIDAAKKMVDVARKNLYGKNIGLAEANILKGLPFENKCFDIAISSYVLHGIKAEQRKVMYAEMSRIARHMVIFHDYNCNRALITDIAEWLEGGDYFNFIKAARNEMEENFKEVRLENVGPQAEWYICIPNEI